MVLACLEWRHAESFKSVIMLLIENGANVNIVQTPMTLHGVDTGDTLLHKFCGTYCDEVMVAFLLKHNAQVDVKDCDGYTPLHYAAMNAQVGIVAQLIARNANALIPNNNNETALDLVKKKLQSHEELPIPEMNEKYKKIQELLKMHLNNIFTCLTIKRRRVSVKILLFDL